METDYVYPDISDRTSPKEWLENGKPDLLENATKRKLAILGEPSSADFSPDLDMEIRSNFKIHLP
jgi:trimethylamine--corrinoid protein Co-methyltransferase